MSSQPSREQQVKERLLQQGFTEQEINAAMSAGPALINVAGRLGGNIFAGNPRRQDVIRSLGEERAAQLFSAYDALQVTSVQVRVQTSKAGATELRSFTVDPLAPDAARQQAALERAVSSPAAAGKLSSIQKRQVLLKQQGLDPNIAYRTPTGSSRAGDLSGITTPEGSLLRIEKSSGVIVSGKTQSGRELGEAEIAREQARIAETGADVRTLGGRQEASESIRRAEADKLFQPQVMPEEAEQLLETGARSDELSLNAILPSGALVSIEQIRQSEQGFIQGQEARELKAQKIQQIRISRAIEDIQDADLREEARQRLEQGKPTSVVTISGKTILGSPDEVTARQISELRKFGISASEARNVLASGQVFFVGESGKGIRSSTGQLQLYDPERAAIKQRRTELANETEIALRGYPTQEGKELLKLYEEQPVAAGFIEVLGKPAAGIVAPFVEAGRRFVESKKPLEQRFEEVGKSLERDIVLPIQTLLGERGIGEVPKQRIEQLEKELGKRTFTTPPSAVGKQLGDIESIEFYKQVRPEYEALSYAGEALLLAVPGVTGAKAYSAARAAGATRLGALAKATGLPSIKLEPKVAVPSPSVAIPLTGKTESGLELAARMTSFKQQQQLSKILEKAPGFKQADILREMQLVERKQEFFDVSRIAETGLEAGKFTATRKIIEASTFTERESQLLATQALKGLTGERIQETGRIRDVLKGQGIEVEPRAKPVREVRSERTLQELFEEAPQRQGALDLLRQQELQRIKLFHQERVTPTAKGKAVDLGKLPVSVSATFPFRPRKKAEEELEIIQKFPEGFKSPSTLAKMLPVIAGIAESQNLLGKLAATSIAEAQKARAIQKPAERFTTAITQKQVRSLAQKESLLPLEKGKLAQPLRSIFQTPKITQVRTPIGKLIPGLKVPTKQIPITDIFTPTTDLIVPKQPKQPKFREPFTPIIGFQESPGRGGSRRAAFGYGLRGRKIHKIGLIKVNITKGDEKIFSLGKGRNITRSLRTRTVKKSKGRKGKKSSLFGV